MQTITTTCKNCGSSLKVTGRGRPKRYCDDACKQAAYRKRLTKPPTLEQVTDLADARPGGYGYVRATTAARDALSGRAGWRSLAAYDRNPTQEEAVRHLSESPRQRGRRLLLECVEEWTRLSELSEGVRIDSTTTAYVAWLLRWKHHPELTEAEGTQLVARVTAATRECLQSMRRQQQMQEILDQVRALRRDVEAGFAHMEARLAALDRANPDDRDFERALAELLKEEGLST